MITSFLDVFVMVTIIGGLGLFSLTYGLQLIKQMIAAGQDKTQENIDRLARLAPSKRDRRMLNSRYHFTTREAFARAWIGLFVSICAAIGCIGAFISVFS